MINNQYEYKSAQIDLAQTQIDSTLNRYAAAQWEPISFVPNGAHLLVVFRRRKTAAKPNNRWFDAAETRIIGHRGASAAAPENTLKAFKLAKEQGADGIEFDVQLSADQHPVVIHDATLERTTNGTGNVRDYAAATLATLDAGEGEPIPLLSQLVETCGIDFLYNIEIKEHGERGRQLVAVIADMIATLPAIASRIVVSSFDHDILPAVRELCPATVAIAALRMKPDRPFPTWLYGQVDHPHYTLVDEAYMAWAREHNLTVNVWTVDDPAEAQRLVALGVNGIVTNKPAYIRASLDDSR